MEKIIEVVEAKIKELNSALDYNRVEQSKLVDRQAVIVLNVQELERELDELRAAPKKRKTRSDKKEPEEKENKD